MTLMQRQPRIEEPAYLAWVRTLPCLVCRRPGPNDPAHLRSAAPRYGKRLTGMGEKSDDRWALPLCRTDHDDQHRNNEMQWWARHGIPDPFAVAQTLHASWPGANRARPERPAKGPRVRPRKPRAERAKVGKSRPLPTGRKLQSANTLKRRSATP